MKAIVIEKYGGEEVLEYREIPPPVLRPNHLLIKNHATSVNPVDFKIRKGELKILTGIIKPRIKILGFDVAGEVIETGARVKNYKKGDQVFAFTGTRAGGGYGEYVSVPEQFASAKPATLSYEESAAVPLAALTALQALRDRGNAGTGKRALINGASGGVGSFAVQIAKALGAEVTGVCSSKNVDLVMSLGADRVIDYTKEDFTKVSREYDIIYDVVPSRSFPECKGALRPNGTYITTVPTRSTFFQILWTSLTRGKRATYIMVKPNGKDLYFVKELIEKEKIRVVIDRSFPLSQVPDAHKYCEAGRSRGKNIITIH